MRRVPVVACVLFAAACGASPAAPENAPSVHLDFDFQRGLQGWTTQFAPLYWEPPFGPVTFETRPLPAPLDPRSGLYFSSGTTFGMMLFGRRVSGLLPSRAYAADFQVEVATDRPAGCWAFEGPAPDLEAYTSATADEPTPRADVTGTLRIEWTIPDAVAIGPVTTGAPCDGSQRVWSFQPLSGSKAATTTDPQGRLWLVFATWGDGGAFLTRYSVTLNAR